MPTWHFQFRIAKNMDSIMNPFSSFGHHVYWKCSTCTYACALCLYMYVYGSVFDTTLSWHCEL